MNADLRRFEYPLEPLLRRTRWRLEALELRMARLAGEIASAERALVDLRTRYEGQCALAARASAERPDPGLHAHTLEWLGRLRQEIASAEREVTVLRARRAELALLFIAERHRVDALERHRDDCLVEFVQEEDRRLASEADRDWLARSAGRGTADAASPSPGAEVHG